VLVHKLDVALPDEAEAAIRATKTMGRPAAGLASSSSNKNLHFDLRFCKWV
jgi:hypothetical protein